MANNPYINKVDYGGNTLMDLTGDTVTPADLTEGVTAHDRSGAAITGTRADIGDPVAIAHGGTGATTAAGALAGLGAAAQSDLTDIIIDGNSTPTGAAQGDFVIVRNSTISGITDGLYTAAQAIPANTAITSAYLAAVDGGGLNKLNGKITTVENRKYIIISTNDQWNISRTITFTGKAQRRVFYGLLVVCGQIGIISPISFGFTGSDAGFGDIVDVRISNNSDGIVANHNVITIPANIGGDWGRIDLVMFYDEDTLTITVT